MSQHRGRIRLALCFAFLCLGCAIVYSQSKVPADQPLARTDRNSQIAHQQLLQKAHRGRIDVYFLGDSITRRWGATDYPDFLANWKQNFYGWNAANFGWGGDTTHNILWRLENGELDGVDPKVIVILAGSNNVGREPGDDAKVADITKGIKAIVDSCRQKAPQATIILTAIFPRNDNIAVVPTINRINENIAKFADGKKIYFLNINDKLADANGLLFEGVSVDKLHLSLKGYQIWADALRPIFKKILGPAAAKDFAPPATGDPSRQNPVISSKAARIRTIAVDAAKVKGPHDEFFKQVVGAGRAAEGLRSDWLRDLILVHRECGFKYIRFHGLLQDEMGVYREDKQGRPIYNFQYIDALYDAILAADMKPFVELSFMPQALASGNKTIFWWKGNVTPPNSYDKWAELIKALVAHWTERYGAAEVKEWLFEVWNEPNLDGFWSGSQAEYFKLYEITARAIKSVSQDYRVGGPATAEHAWITETIDFAARSKAPLDFISTHEYGVKGVGVDENGSQRLFLDPSPDAMIKPVRESRQRIKSSALPALPLHYTEWSTSYSPRDPVHDSYISAPYILSKLKGTEGFAASMSYWTFTDIFEENGPVPSPFHGGFGLINFQGLRKPAFYAYQFLQRLGPDELGSSDTDSWACRDGKGVQILFWNFTPPQTNESDQVFYKRDVPAKDLGVARVSISGLKAGAYELSVYQIGYQVNDVYGDYLQLGSPPALTREQVNELAHRNDGHPVVSARVQVLAGQAFARDFPLRENDVYLITLKRTSRN